MYTSTEIKTQFFGLKPCNTDMTLLLLFTFLQPRESEKILVFYADEILVMGTVYVWGIKNCGYLIS